MTSNEENRSTAEELQSDGAEAEPSREELQSVNVELVRRVSDLGRAHDDLKTLLESTQIATILLDSELRVRSFTPAAAGIFPQSDVGRPIDLPGSRISYPELGEDVRKVLAGLGMVERELTSRAGRHYIARIHPYHGGQDHIADALLIFLDVTGTVKAQAALRESEARLKGVLAELQHRVRNTLSVVKSIANRTAETSDSVEGMVEHLNGRLDAFARVQAAVIRAPETGIELVSLIEDELLAHAIREGERLTVNGPSVALAPKAAESLSLALHELVTNAVKYGALGAREGTIDVSWNVEDHGDEGRRLRLVWQEEGASQRPAEPKREGFGMELLTRILPYDLGAETDVSLREGGLRFTLDMPLQSPRRRDGETMALSG